MRTTINLAEDVAREVERLRRERGIGVSEAVNELARAGFDAVRPVYHYEHRSTDMGARLDLTNVADVLEMLDEPDQESGSARAG